MCCESQQESRHASRGRGFTLMEMMVVLVLIGLLAAVVAINVRSYLVKGRQTAARADIAVIEQALATFYAEYGRYPNTQEGLEVLVRPTERLPDPPLLKFPRDPWGRPYVYTAPGRTGPYEVICYGADGRERGEGADADITSAADIPGASAAGAPVGTGVRP